MYWYIYCFKSILVFQGSNFKCNIHKIITPTHSSRYDKTIQENQVTAIGCTACDKADTIAIQRVYIQRQSKKKKELGAYRLNNLSFTKSSHQHIRQDMTRWFYREQTKQIMTIRSTFCDKGNTNSIQRLYIQRQSKENMLGAYGRNNSNFHKIKLWFILEL